MPGLSDYQSIIQLAAGLNLAFPITATMRKPAQIAIRQQVSLARATLNELRTDIASAILSEKQHSKRINIATATLQVGIDEVSDISEFFSRRKDDWAFDDYAGLSKQVIASIASIIFLFIAVQAPPHQISVGQPEYHGMVVLSAGIKMVYTIICLFLFSPLMFSIVKLGFRSFVMRNTERKLQRIVDETRRDVWKILRGNERVDVVDLELPLSD
jgi:hypothetical protein